MENPGLKLRQDVASDVRDRMLNIMMHFDPVRKLTVGDVIYLADTVQTLAFEAVRAVDAGENRT